MWLSDLFQFLVVRLEVINNEFSVVLIEFQFLVVRLEEELSKRVGATFCLFQFLVVRLEGMLFSKSKPSGFISIPCGAIRRILQKWSPILIRYFNSLWCD